jgi:hypothetical protein
MLVEWAAGLDMSLWDYPTKNVGLVSTNAAVPPCPGGLGQGDQFD